jgi:hypothetical protein
VESTAVARGMIEQRAEFFFGDLLPYFRQIGIAE